MKLVLLVFMLASACIGTFGIPCSKSDPQLKACLEPWVDSTVNSILWDPFSKASATFSGSSGLITINGILTNIVVTGLNNSDITWGYDAVTNRANVSQRIPQLTITGREQTNGRYAFIPYSSDGNLTLVLVNLTTSYRIQFVTISNTYQIQDITVLSNGIQTGSMQIISTDPAKQPQDSAISSYFNSNPSGLYSGFQDVYVQVVIPIIKEKANPILSQYLTTDILTP